MAFSPKPEGPVVGPSSLMEYAKELGIIDRKTSVKEVGWRRQKAFMTVVMELGGLEDGRRKDSHYDGVDELKLQRQFGELDFGQDDDSDFDSDSDARRVTGKSRAVTPPSSAGFVGSRRDSAASSKRLGGGRERTLTGGCFKDMCAVLGVKVKSGIRSVLELDADAVETLSKRPNVHIGCVVYGTDDPRNHVVPVHKNGKAGLLLFDPVDPALKNKTVTYSLTSPQEFFNVGGRFNNVKFYADRDEGDQDGRESVRDMSDVPPPGVVPEGVGAAFGGDAGRQFGASVRDRASLRSASGGTAFGRTGDVGRSRAQSGFDNIGSGSGLVGSRPPGSVVDESEHAGSNNTTGGVVRAKRRIVRGLNTFDDAHRVRRNYQVAVSTQFNNLEELYLDTISKDHAQEIVEELFNLWGLPVDQPETMKYAEDLLHAFLIARTASNKADYNSEYEVPTKQGEVTVSFSDFSRLLADKHGITRRNFARGVADDLRSYLNRPENQMTKSRSAQRVGADPQYGDLCFDGSTGCTNVTSSEATFSRLLESRNLYERDDLIAQGASEKLMQGLHGGVRSVVQR